MARNRLSKLEDRPRASSAASSSQQASEKGRLAQIDAAERLIRLGDEGVASAEKMAKAGSDEIRAQAAKALATQFQSAGRRAAGGGTLASLGQSSRDTARAITSSDAQNEGRIMAAKAAAAQTLASESQKIADLEDVQGAAEERFSVIVDGAPSQTMGFGDVEAIEYYQKALEREADPIVRGMIEDKIIEHQKDVGAVESGAALLKDIF